MSKYKIDTVNKRINELEVEIKNLCEVDELSLTKLELLESKRLEL